MVCVPCIFVPILLFIWHRFLQPIFLKFWNPFGKVEDKKKEGDKTADKTTLLAMTKKKAESQEVPGAVESKRPRIDLDSEFPYTIEGFGYKFNEDGELRSIEGGEPYEFEVKEDDHEYNQKRYEALGNVITHHIYDLLEQYCDLKRLVVPFDATPEEPQTAIFVSENAQTCDRLMILIHGAGAVRAGQWARRLIINDDLNCGTQIPFIKRGMEEGYGIVVMNTNDNKVKVNGVKKTIRGNQNPEAHGAYVWSNYILKSKAKEIYLVAHSAGGCVTTSLSDSSNKAIKEDFNARIRAVAFTDSVHYVYRPEQHKKLIECGINWIASNEPLDTPIQRMDPVPARSAGHNKHEWTSWSSFHSIFEYFTLKAKESFENGKIDTAPFVREEPYVLPKYDLKDFKSSLAGNDLAEKVPDNAHDLSDSDSEDVNAKKKSN